MKTIISAVAIIMMLIIGSMSIASCGSGGGNGRGSGDNAPSDDDMSFDDDIADDDSTDDDSTVDDDATDDDASDDDSDDDTADYDYIAVEGQIRGIVHAPSGSIIYCADVKNNRILILDTAQSAITGTIEVGSRPTDLDVNPAGTRLWVATSGASAVTYANLSSKETGQVNLSYPPVGIAVGGAGKVYVIEEDGSIGIIDEENQTLINEVDGLGEDILDPTFIEIDRTSNWGYLANSGLSPSTLIRVDLNSDDLTVLDSDEFGSLGSNGFSLSLAPNGESLVFPNGSGQGTGYFVYLLDATDFTHILGEFDIGTYPEFMEYDPLGAFIAGINADPSDKRLYIMNLETFLPIKVIDVTEWINANSPNADLLLLRSNADGSVLAMYAEDTYADIGGYLYLIHREKLF